MRTALVSTVLDEAENLPAWITSIRAQSRPPDEVVVVDGGSSDGTRELLEKWSTDDPSVSIIEQPGAGISAGRNLAIGAARSEAVAVTDAGCLLDPDWLRHLIAALDNGAEVAMGFYEAEAARPLHRLLACLNLPDAAEVDPEAFMPSSRSVAFLKRVWEQAGGYPEWLRIGEDMYFNFAVLQTGARRVFVPEATVRWQLRPTLPATFRQYFRYAEGDGIAGMYPRRHGLRFATYAGALIAAQVLDRRTAALLLAGATAVRMRPAYRRTRRRLAPAEARLGIVALPALEVFLDVAKMSGYLSGLMHRRGRRPYD